MLLPLPVSGSRGEPDGALRWRAVPPTLGCTQEDNHIQGPSTPRTLAGGPIQAPTLDTPCTKLLLICGKPLVAQNRNFSEFLPFKNDFSRLGLCHNALANVFFFFFHGIMVSFSHLSPYQFWKIKKSFHQPCPVVVLWRARLISSLFCDVQRSPERKDQWLIWNTWASSRYPPSPRCDNQSIRTLCSVYFSPLSPLEICVELELNHGTHLIKRQMAK